MRKLITCSGGAIVSCRTVNVVGIARRTTKITAAPMQSVVGPVMRAMARVVVAMSQGAANQGKNM